MLKRCKICDLVKEIIEFNPASKYKDKIYYRGECKLCNLQSQKTNGQKYQIKYRGTEKGKINKQKHKKTQKYRDQQREYERDRLANDVMFRCKKNLRDRLRIALKVKYWKKDTNFNKYIGCSLEELRIHLENQFTIGMTWDNYGHGENKWTLDHIQPLSLAKTEEEMYKLCHYQNLQPMWYIDNIKKSNKT